MTFHLKNSLCSSVSIILNESRDQKFNFENIKLKINSISGVEHLITPYFIIITGPQFTLYLYKNHSQDSIQIGDYLYQMTVIPIGSFRPEKRKTSPTCPGNQKICCFL